MNTKTASAVLSASFKTEPYWWEEARPFESSASLPEQADILIVGAGFCGLSAGIRCLELGKSVVVVDAGPIGGAASSRSGAMLSSGQKFLLNGASRRFSDETIQKASALHAEAFDFVKSLALDCGLDFDFQQCGRLFLASLPSDAQRLEHHAQVLRAKAGVTVRVLMREALAEEIGSDYYFGGIVVEEFGGIHPSKFGRALANKLRALGGEAISHARVISVQKDNAGFIATTEKGPVRARHVLFATNGYTDQALGYVRRRLAPAASYIIATEPLPPALMAEIMPKRRMYSDSKRNLWYFRPSPDGTRVLLGGRPCIVNVPVEQAAYRLHTCLLRVFPQLSSVKLTHCWTGNVAMTASHLQHLGSVNDIYYAVGCNGSGAAIMPYLGRLAAERMLKVRKEPTLFESAPFKPFPPYGDKPWFVPLAAAGYNLLDRVDRLRAGGALIPAKINKNK